MDPELSDEVKCGGDGQDDDGHHVRRRTSSRALYEATAEFEGRREGRKAPTRHEERTRETRADPCCWRCVERDAARTQRTNQQPWEENETDVRAKETEADG